MGVHPKRLDTQLAVPSAREVLACGGSGIVAGGESASQCFAKARNVTSIPVLYMPSCQRLKDSTDAKCN